METFPSRKSIVFFPEFVNDLQSRFEKVGVKHKTALFLLWKSAIAPEDRLLYNETGREVDSMIRKRILTFLCLILILSGCAGRVPAATALTPEEIAEANAALSWDTAVRSAEISCFFTSYYASPEALDLGAFLRYCPGSRLLEDEDAEEFQAVILASGMPLTDPLPSQYFVPVHRYCREDVSALLKKYANITVKDLIQTDGALYLKEYDAYYTFTSDFAPGYFQCVAGQRSGNTIQLWSESDEDGSREVLTVQKKGEAYYIFSFLREDPAPLSH